MMNKLRQTLVLLLLLIGMSLPVMAEEPTRHMPVRVVHATPDSVAPAPEEPEEDVEIVLGEAGVATVDTAAVVKESPYDRWEERSVVFNPDPTRAVWLSALFPGLGQVYNRRYWKLPIIVGGYMGLVYATSWNNNMLDDYTRAYRDIMDNDPSTKSYMDFFPPTTNESDLDQNWLKNVLQSRKNYYRRNRDLCIIAMVGVYFLAMIDAYVDASLSHFDITPDLSMDVTPVIFKESRNDRPAFGLAWAVTF